MSTDLINGQKVSDTRRKFRISRMRMYQYAEDRCEANNKVDGIFSTFKFIKESSNEI